MNTWTPMMLPSRGAFDFSAGQLLDLIGWGAITLLAIAVLLRAGKHLPATIEAAEDGTAWPAGTAVMSVAATWYLSGQIPSPTSWSMPITSTYALLCDTVTSLALLTHFVAALMLCPLVFLAPYALARWSLTTANPSRWGPLTRLQVVGVSVRRWLAGRRLADTLSRCTAGPTVSWWVEHDTATPATPEALPMLTTRFTPTTAVDHPDLERVIATTPQISAAVITDEDSASRVCVRWDVKALAGIHATGNTPGRGTPRTPRRPRRTTAPALVTPADSSATALGSPS